MENTQIPNNDAVLKNKLITLPSSGATALRRLHEGNRRFTSGVRAVEPLMSYARMAELAEKGQKPFAIILTCSDSRSPVELVFDQGVGDLFVVRVAGNIIAPSLLASIEFAAKNFGCALILVLGHTNCGAVSATISYMKDPKPLPSSHLEELVGRIQPAVEIAQKRCQRAEEELLQESTRTNVHHSLQLMIEQSKIINELVEKREVSLVGGILDIHTGMVEFLD